MYSYTDEVYRIHTLPKGGMFWEIHPPRTERFPEGGDFAPRGKSKKIPMLSQGSTLDNMVPVDHIILYHPCCQEIHPYSAMNIDSVKINTSLIMMKECFSSSCMSSFHQDQCNADFYCPGLRRWNIGWGSPLGKFIVKLQTLSPGRRHWAISPARQHWLLSPRQSC